MKSRPILQRGINQGQFQNSDGQDSFKLSLLFSLGASLSKLWLKQCKRYVFYESRFKFLSPEDVYTKIEKNTFFPRTNHSSVLVNKLAKKSIQTL